MVTVEEPELKYYPPSRDLSFKENITLVYNRVKRSQNQKTELIKELEKRMTWYDRRSYLGSIAHLYKEKSKEREYTASLETIAATEKEHPSVRSLARKMLERYLQRENSSGAGADQQKVEELPEIGLQIKPQRHL